MTKKKEGGKERTAQDEEELHAAALSSEVKKLIRSHLPKAKPGAPAPRRPTKGDR